MVICDMDDNVQVTSLLTYDETVEDVRRELDVSETPEEAEEDEEEAPPTTREMLKAMATL